MPLKTTAESCFLLAALLPPGSVAARLAAYRRELFRTVGSPAALAFPCFAPLSPLDRLPSGDELGKIAREAPRRYGRLTVFSSFVLLAPMESPAAASSGAPLSPPETPPGSCPVPFGLGFPLALFPDNQGAEKSLPEFPAPPRLSFRTFEAAAARVRLSDPRLSGLAWEILETLRYPVRILAPR